MKFNSLITLRRVSLRLSIKYYDNQGKPVEKADGRHATSHDFLILCMAFVYRSLTQASRWPGDVVESSVACTAAHTTTTPRLKQNLLLSWLSRLAVASTKHRGLSENDEPSRLITMACSTGLWDAPETGGVHMKGDVQC